MSPQLPRRSQAPLGALAPLLTAALLVSIPCLADNRSNENGPLNDKALDDQRLGGAALGGALFDTPDDRYPARLLPLRLASDLVAIPAGMPSWSKADWATFTLTASVVAVLMIDTPWGESADMRFQRWVRSQVGGPERRLVWTPVGDIAIWAAIWTPTLGSFFYGWKHDEPRLVEMTSLMLEAFGIAQVYQLGFKALLGREGPMQDGTRLFGPPGFLHLFPAGTPSGHAATLYAMLSTVENFWRDARLSAALHLFGTLFCATLVTDEYHYVSDVIWGAAMGWFIGRWVVDHRASLPASSSSVGRRSRATAPEALWIPEIAPGSGRYGLRVALRF